MSKETILRIRASEEQASEIRRDALAASKATVADAKAKADAICEKARADGEAMCLAAQKGESDSLASLSEKVKGDAEKAAAEKRESAKAHFDDAVEYIVRSVTG